MSNISYGSLNFGNASGNWNHGLPTIPRSAQFHFQLERLEVLLLSLSIERLLHLLILCDGHGEVVQER